MVTAAPDTQPRLTRAIRPASLTLSGVTDTGDQVTGLLTITDATGHVIAVLLDDDQQLTLYRALVHVRTAGADR